MVTENTLQPPADWNNVTYRSVTHVRYSNAAGTSIDMDVVFDHIGPDPIPFTAMPTDEFKHGRELFERAVAGDFGPVAPYVAPPARIPQVVTAAQGGIALIQAGLMDAAQSAANAAETPAEYKWAWERAQTWERTSPALNYIADKAGITQAQMDDLFVAAAQIQA